MRVNLSIYPFDYLDLCTRHVLAIDTFRRLPGQTYKLRNDGVPRLDKVNIDSRESRQEAITRFINDLYALNEPWRQLITDRDAFNHELLQFPYHVFRMQPNLGEFGVSSRKTCDEFREPVQRNKNVGLSKLGSKIDNSTESQERRKQFLDENRQRHVALKVGPYLKIFGTTALFAPDQSYVLTILGALGNGIKHNDPNVRNASVFILGTLLNTALLKLSYDLSLTTDDDIHLRNCYAQESLIVITGIFNLLHERPYGVYDSNENVKSRAEDLDLRLQDAFGIASKYRIKNLFTTNTICGN